MKNFFSAIFIAITLVACSQYDDTELRGKLDNLESRVDELDRQIQRTNANLDVLKTIVEALDGIEYITDVEEVKNDVGSVIGYTITFAQAGRKTIYNGKDAVNPDISAAMHPELNVYCWQMDGEWLIADGKPVPVAGATPQLKIENGQWKISYDGTNWENLAVTGEGVTVVCQFEDVIVNEENNSVTFIPSSGESFTIPLGARFALVISQGEVRCEDGSTVEIPYTVTGADEDTDVYVVVTSGSWTVRVLKTDYASGVIKVTAPSVSENGTVLIAASNHKGQSDLCALTLISDIVRVLEIEAETILSLGGEVIVDVVTNIDYTVSIDVDWLKHTSTVPTKAVRYETLTFTAEKNPTDQIRIANVSLLDASGYAVQTFRLAQEKNGGDFVLNWVYSDADVTPSFGYSEPAVDAAGNVYVISNNTLVKINASGTQAWNQNVPLTLWGGNCADITPSLETDGSVVYAAGGTDDQVGVYAVNADGSEKWSRGIDEFFRTNVSNKLSFWRSGVAVGDEHLMVACTRGHSINAFDKDDGSRTSYASSESDGSKMVYSLTCSPVLTKDGVVAARSGLGLIGANRALLETPNEQFKTASQDFYVPVGMMTTYRAWSFNDRSPVIALEYENVNYVVSGGTESKNIHFHVWCQKSERGLGTTVPVLPADSHNLDYRCTITGMKLTSGTGGGGLIAGARNEIIVSSEPAGTAGPYTSGGFVAVWPATNSLDEAFAYSFEHGTTVPGSCAVDNNGYVHVVDINGEYFVLRPDYDGKTVSVVRSVSLLDIVEGCGKDGITDAESVTVKSSVKLGTDGKIYINANFTKGGSTVGATVCFSYAETTGICSSSSWPQAGADPMNTNRQVGYRKTVNS